MGLCDNWHVRESGFKKARLIDRYALRDLQETECESGGGGRREKKDSRRIRGLMDENLAGAPSQKA